MTKKPNNTASRKLNYHDFLKTEIQKGKDEELNNMRKKRISEALNWKRGPSLASPQKHIITILPNGMEVYFLKPGKEVFRKRNPNPHDMTPCVGQAGEPYGFDTVWKQLSKISVYDFEIFRAVLTLIYRNAYMLDHVEEREGIVRYKPRQGIAYCIKELEKCIGDLVDYGLLGFLHFMDILGWNEDVKYNVVEDIRRHSSEPQKIDWSLVYDTMTTLSRTRGICPPRQRDLLKWLSPYIVE